MSSSDIDFNVNTRIDIAIFPYNFSDHDLIESALNFVKEFMPRMQKNQLQKLMDDFCRLSTHDNPQCRGAVYNVADLIYDKYRYLLSHFGENYHIGVLIKVFFFV